MKYAFIVSIIVLSGCQKIHDADFPRLQDVPDKELIPTMSNEDIAELNQLQERMLTNHTNLQKLNDRLRHKHPFPIRPKLKT